MRIRGVPVSHDNIRALIALLYTHGTPDDTRLAVRLIRCLDTAVELMAVNDDEVDTLIAALDDPPDGLVELRGKLMRGRG